MAFNRSICLSSPLAALSEEIVSRRRKIDEEAKLLQERIRALKMERNTLCPIYCLSPDVLSHVFAEVKYEYEIAYGELDKCWTVVAQVSRYWREVALGRSTLWSTIDVSFPGAEEWLRRAKGGYLSVHAQLPAIDDLFIRLLQDMQRIRRLSVYIAHDFSLSQEISTLLTSPAPALESLRLIEVKPDPPPSSPAPTIPTSIVPTNLFSSEAPALQRLELSGCNLDQSSSLFSNLTHLCLSNCSPAFSLRSLLTILEMSSCMQVLDIHGGFITSDLDRDWELIDGRPSVYEIVSLPFLQILQVVCPLAPQGLSLIAHLALKPTTYVEFHGHTEHMSLASILQVHRLCRQTPPIIHNLVYTFAPKTSSVQLRAYSGNTADDTVLNVNLSSNTNIRNISGLWAAELSQLPLSGLHTFHTNIPIPPTIWEGVFADIPSLRSIIVAGDIGPPFFTFSSNPRIMISAEAWLDHQLRGDVSEPLSLRSAP